MTVLLMDDEISVRAGNGSARWAYVFKLAESKRT